MEHALFQGLQRSRPLIEARWSEMLRARPVTSPLANPATLDWLFESTIDEVFRRVSKTTGVLPFEPISSHANLGELCACGGNPLLAYYFSCEQVFLDALQDIGGPTNGTNTAAEGELREVIRSMASRDVASLCSLCQYRQPEGPAAAEEPGKLELFPSTTDVATSYLARKYLDERPSSPSVSRKYGRYGPED